MNKSDNKYYVTNRTADDHEQINHLTTEVIVKNESTELAVNNTLQIDGSNVDFLPKNDDNLDLTESFDQGSQTGYNKIEFNLNSSRIRKNSKVLFSPEEPEEDDEIIAAPNYSVATMLEENDFAVSAIYQMANQLKRTYLFKVLIMGDSNTGKTSFVKRFTCNTTPRNYVPTIGLEFSMKIINLKNAQKEIKLQIWDISGEKNQDSLTKLYFRDACGAMIFFDCSKEATFRNVDKWKEKLDANVRLSDGAKLPTILIGNKCDLKKEGLCQEQTYIKEHCRQLEFNEYFSVSAKTNKNVKESIDCLIKLIFQSRMEFHYNQENNIKLDESEEELRSGFKCFC